MACNRRASYSSFITSLPPLLSPPREEEERDDDEDDEEKEEKPAAALPLLVNLSRNGKIIKRRNGLNRSLISPRSFSLSDLRHV